MHFQALKHLDSMSGGMPVQRFDSLSAFVQNQLQQVMVQTYDRKYPALDALEHIPAESNVAPGAMAWSYDSFEMRGSAQIHGSGARDLPRADVSAKRSVFPIRTLVSSYAWTLEELEAAQFAGVPLSTKRSDAARRAIATREHQIALNGDTGSSLPGWLTNLSIPVITVPTGDWLNPARTADEILADLNAMVDAIFVGTQRVHEATDIALPNAHFRRVAVMRIPNTSDTILSYFLKTNPKIRSIKPLTELATANPSGGPMAACYEKSPENLSAIIPLAFQQLEPSMRGLEVEIPVRERIGGTVVFYPMSGVFAINI